MDELYFTSLNGYYVKDKKAIHIFNSLNDLKNSSYVKNNEMVKTLGFYTENDGGGGLYKIVNDDTIVSDNAIVIDLLNNLKAVLVIENNTINFKQLGAKNTLEDENFDNKEILEKYVNICDTNNKTYKLIIPSGIWLFSPTHIQRTGGVIIEGLNHTGSRTFTAPVIRAISEQDYIWKFGGLADMENTSLAYDKTNTNNNIKNLVFSSDYKQLNYGALVLEYANYGFYDKLSFEQIRGTGLYIRSSWENYFGMLNFRGIKDLSKPSVYFAKTRPISSVSANISSSSFDKFIFENCSGDLFYAPVGSSFVNNQIGEINVEYGYNKDTEDTITNITADTDFTDMISLFMFNGNMSGVTIDTINWTGHNSLSEYVTHEETNYYFKSLFNSIGGGSTEGYRYDCIVNKISSRSILQILTSISPYAAAFSFMLGNYNDASSSTPTIHNTLFDLYHTGKINYNSIYSRSRTITPPFNSNKLYKTATYGSISTDRDATGDKIIIGKAGGSTNTIGRYPFSYSTTKKTKWILRVKTNDDGGYYFILRGQHNGSNVNTTYSASDLEPNKWYDITVTMNYDYFSPIQLINQNCFLDTITYLSEESI